MDESGGPPHDSRDEADDEDDYEEGDRGNRLLGFMFGNVDGYGDLDVDYLDEDAKEHLAALADKLGSSLTDIDLTKSPSATTDASEQDYDKKAEDAINYEDIEEQYEGPEVQATSEEDHLLSKKEYFSADVSLVSLSNKVPVFDEENYDEDEDTAKETEVVDNISEGIHLSSSGEPLELLSEKVDSPDGNFQSPGSSEAEHIHFDSEDFQEEDDAMQEAFDSRSGVSLPVLCVEDGMVILRFSEIFGVHEPLKKVERRDHHRYSSAKDHVRSIDLTDNVEEDEEVFLKSFCHGTFSSKNLISKQDDHVQVKEGGLEPKLFGVHEHSKDSCVCAQPMKEGMAVDTFAGRLSTWCPKFYPLDQQDWENDIVWGNSPPVSPATSKSCVLSETDTADFNNVEGEEVEPQNLEQSFHPEPEDCSLVRHSVLVDPFGSRKVPELTYCETEERRYHSQILTLDAHLKSDGLDAAEVIEDEIDELHRGDAIRRFSKLSLQNKALLEGSWLDDIVWDPSESVPKPKLILDLQDEKMLFEILDHKDFEHLRSRAGAMITNHLSKSSFCDAIDVSGQGATSVSRFNISNDKYYSNRKSSQQPKSHAKKRAIHGVKIMHSVPALKLQTMKPKLSNKDIANFHRPKALWFPHDNVVAAKVQGLICTQGPIKIILKSLGGKGTKLIVDAEEPLSSVKAKASKKLDFRSSEKVKIFYSRKELEDDKTLALQNVRPNSVLHLMRTKIHLWPRAQKLPGENKPLRPPGAFKKKSELSVKVGHVFLMEYCEERPLLLGNIGMGARLCTYYQKLSPGDQTASSMRSGSNGQGHVLTLDPADKSPFLGDIRPGCCQSSLETNMFRAPVFPHKLSSTDYLLVRSAKGMLSLRRIDRIFVVGQQEPHMEVLSPGTKNIQAYLGNMLSVYVYREFRAKEKPGFLPYVRADELSALFPGLTEAFLRKRLKHCADLQKGSSGHLFWVMKHNFRIPSEEELRRMVPPENVCCYESMQAGLYRLKHLGISRLTLPVGLSSAMNQLPDEAIALAAASHIERELQITSWNLSSNFVACTNQDRENIERLEITGVGDPSGRGLGFSYVRVTSKTSLTSAVVKKKASSVRGGSSVTGTDADLRRLSMDAAREVLLKFNVPVEQIEKMTRWHRIAMVRKLSSEQAASGVKVDATTLNKFARGQRMSFLQLQQQTREKCQEIWDRQVQSLSADDGDEAESDSEANSDLDSFAGDLENLLDAEECDEGQEGSFEYKPDKADGVRGLKMRRRPSQTQTEEEIEDAEAEAALIWRWLDDDDNAIKKKTKPPAKEVGFGSQLGSEIADFTKKTNTAVKRIINTTQPDGSFTSKEIVMPEPKEVENILVEKNMSGKVKAKKGSGKNDDVLTGVVKKQNKIAKDGLKVIKEKKPNEKPVREHFICGACGQLGHMRTNKNCPKYGEDLEVSELEHTSGKSHLPEVASQIQLKIPNKKLAPKGVTKKSGLEALENVEKSGAKLHEKVLSLKLKCGPSDKLFDKNLPGAQNSDKQINAESEAENKSIGKVNKLIISNKTKSEDIQHEVHKPSVVIRLPVEAERVQPRKKIIIKQPKGIANVEQVTIADFGLDDEFRKTKKIAELTSSEKHRKQKNRWFAEDAKKRQAIDERRLWEEEEKRRNKERIAEERTRRIFLEEQRIQEEQQRLYEIRMYEEAKKKEREERQKAKKKKKKKQKPDFKDEYLEEYKTTKNDRRIPERDRAAKRRPAVNLELHSAEHAPPTKRRRGGEVVLSNILEHIVDRLKDVHFEVSYLFHKPVSKKEAPDYLDIIKHPMDLATIREKVRRMEYKNREDFRHDVWQITFNAHAYNDGRNPGIPPLADQLLEFCDYYLDDNDASLTEAEAGIEELRDP